jgi:hypothetical protein
MIKTILLACFLLSIQLIYSQEAVSASGGEATGSGGTSSYTVGQLLYSTNTGSNVSIIQGVQQSIELLTLSNLELTALTLSAVTYPNPTSDYIVLALRNSQLTDLSYVICDLQGRIVRKGSVQQQDTTIAMQTLAIGAYILKVNQDNHALKSFKIIKK